VSDKWIALVESLPRRKEESPWNRATTQITCLQQRSKSAELSDPPKRGG